MKKAIKKNDYMKEIFESVKNDTDCISNINIDELLDAANGKNLEYLDNKTFKIINQENFEALKSIGCTGEQLEKYCKYLTNYRLVNEVYELHKRKWIKTIRIFDYANPDKKPEIILKNFGLVTDVKFNDRNTHVHCILLNPTKFFKYTFDYFLTFQKLSFEEQLILLAYDHIEKIEEKGEHVDKEEYLDKNTKTFENLQNQYRTLEREKYYEKKNTYSNEFENNEIINEDYDPTSYDPTSYDPTSYDPLSYDPLSYDPLSYDPLSYDHLSYDPSYDPLSFDPSYES
jgi:hypothetical protein